MTPPPTQCADCRERPCPACQLAALLGAQPVVAPAGLTDRVFVAVTRDRRRRRQQARVGRLGVAAAALLLGVTLAANGLRPRDPVALAEVVPVPPPPATPTDPFGDARDAVASVTQRAGETALAPARNLLAGLGEPPEQVTPAAELPTPTVSVAVLDPLTDTTRRAVSFFLKDVRQLAAPEPEANR